jgi:hypothetical protein
MKKPLPLFYFGGDNFSVDTFRFATSDKSICPSTTTGCKYSLDGGQWYVLRGNMSGYMLSGTMKSTSGTASKFFQISSFLTKVTEQLTPNNHTVQNLTGTISFGNGVKDYSVTTASLDISNQTLRLAGSCC